MKTGTKSILFGVHQFVLHPLTVYAAWIWSYRKLPNWREAVCIVIHDWGYWGKTNMDDEEGEKHVEWAAAFALRFLDEVDSPCPYWNLCIFHSRHYARKYQIQPSQLCWADKASLLFEAWWTYLPRAWASGELTEYRVLASSAGLIPLWASHREWFSLIRYRLVKLGREKRGDAVSYANLQ